MQVVACFISCSFPYHRSTAYVNHFVASVCPLYLLFLKGFKYHRQSMILLSLPFRNLYQIYVLVYRRGPNTDPWGT